MNYHDYYLQTADEATMAAALIAAGVATAEYTTVPVLVADPHLIAELDASTLGDDFTVVRGDSIYWADAGNWYELFERPILTAASGHEVSVIGTWYERTGGTGDEPVMTQLPGWHVNVRSAEPIEWPDSVTLHDPRTPWRVFG